MAINCRLNKNITLNQLNDDGSQSNCNSTDISMGVGGIRNPIYVYNIDDVENLKFENDNRADDSLVVDTIITDAAFYSIDFSSANYTEEYEDGKWTHTLTLDINNITSLFEDLLSDSVNGRYLVAFKPNGDNDYRMFGWKNGATLDYSLNIAEDSQGYTVELTDESEYPLFSVYNDNFKVKDKVYTPVFKPLYSVSYCEMEGTKNTGYAVAMYVVKVNSAGQALDSDNKLCQWSGKRQDAYKYIETTSDGGYNILGTYNKDAEFEGLPVRVYDLDICPTDVDGTITINGKKIETINLNSSKTSQTVTINSDNSWTMLSNPTYVTVSPSNGSDGSSTVSVFHNGVGGSDTIVFQNRKTKERVTLYVNVNIIKIDSRYTYPYGTTEFTLTPTVQGGSETYSYTVSPSLSITKAANGYLVCKPTVSQNEQDFMLTLTHDSDSNERKVVSIKILGNNANPSWQVLGSFCEIV